MPFHRDIHRSRCAAAIAAMVLAALLCWTSGLLADPLKARWLVTGARGPTARDQRKICS